MPTGIYKHKPRPEWVRQKISQSLMGCHLSTKHKRAISVGNIGKHNYWLGKQFSEDHKQKIGRAGLGHPVRDETRNKIGRANAIKLLGKVIPEPVKLKISTTMKAVAPRGENSQSWKGGISKLPYAFEFDKELKERIRQRDDYTCQVCGVPQCECYHPLTVHHIDYNKQNTSDDNLISLCHHCNSKVNFNRQYWERILKMKVNLVIFG